MSESDEFVPVPEPTKKRKPAAKKRAKVKKGAKKPVVTEPEYNVDVDPETGAMILQENHYYRLVIAEQRIKIQERDLRIAKAALKDFQSQANTQLLAFQSRIKELSKGLEITKQDYMGEAKLVEEATRLSLKDWLIDDDRILRPIEKKEQS